MQINGLMLGSDIFAVAFLLQNTKNIGKYLNLIISLSPGLFPLKFYLFYLPRHLFKTI